MVFIYIWQKDVVLFFYNNSLIHLHLASFYAQNTLKKLAMQNTDWTNRWTSTEGACAPWPNMHFYNWLLSWQNKNLEGKSSSGFSFTAKMLHETMHLTSFYWDQITYN